MTASLFGGFGDQSLRKIVGELPTRYETAAAARAGSCPQPAQQLDARHEKTFRAWRAKPAAEIVPCNCGWRPDPSDHYRVHRPGPIVRRTTRHEVRPAH